MSPLGKLTSDSIGLAVRKDSGTALDSTCP